MGYYYHWMRDGGLCIKTWLEINDNAYEAVRSELEAYVGWVAKVQQKPDPNGIDVRVEPKFTIPDGEPYVGGWCRPQTDGPALRALALAQWGRIVAAQGDGLMAEAEAIWQLVAFDLDWVTANWGSNGCDLWEEVQSEDFFFNRMGYIYSLHEAALLAESLGHGDEAAALVAKADEIRTATLGHFRDGFLYESTNRPYDGAVIHAVATFGAYLFPPDSEEAAATVQVLARAFCEEYPVNQAATAAGRPGVLIGRYPGDTYQGGNPWQLLTAVLAELFYLAGQTNFEAIETLGGADFELAAAEKTAWRSLLHLPSAGVTAGDLARAQVAAGDAVLARLYERVSGDGGRVDEQMDKVSGGQVSAKGLTWSYANILHALHTRQQLAAYL
jgi:glucoamylase